MVRPNKGKIEGSCMVRRQPELRTDAAHGAMLQARQRQGLVAWLQRKAGEKKEKPCLPYRPHAVRKGSLEGDRRGHSSHLFHVSSVLAFLTLQAHHLQIPECVCGSMHAYFLRAHTHPHTPREEEDQGRNMALAYSQAAA
eukprot:1158282-Pelagomonas_calceolata.AAC.14